jgi:hypothetical protein
MIEEGRIMKRIILLLLLFIFLVALAGSNYSMNLKVTADNHSDNTNKNSLFIINNEHHDEHEHNDASEEIYGIDKNDPNEHDHSKGEDNCGVGHYHDSFIMDAVEQEPWRHPERLKQDMWLKRTTPVVALFLLSIILRPVINKLLRRVSK